MSITKKYTWILYLQNLVGTTVGIVMLSIGLSLILNTVAKVYILGYETSSYFSAEDMCRFSEPGVISPSEVPPQPLTGEEKEKCITRETEREKKRYLREKMENMIDGGILVLIGAPLWFFHRRKK